MEYRKSLEHKKKCIEHYLNGGDVSFCAKVYNIKDGGALIFDGGIAEDYQIIEKTEPKLRPWTWKELMENRDEWFTWHRGGCARKITDIKIDEEKVWFAGGWYSTEKFCEKFKLVTNFKTGDAIPCGVEE